MKKIIAIVLVIVLLVCIGVTASASAADRGDNGSPSRGVAHDTMLVTIAEDVTISSVFPNNLFESDYINVESYRNFKLYAKMTPGPTTLPPVPLPPPPNVMLRMWDNPLGEGPPYPGPLSNPWMGFPSTTGEERWTMVVPFEGLYSNISVSVFNGTALNPPGSPPPPTPPVGYDITVDLYLFMAKE